MNKNNTRIRIGSGKVLDNTGQLVENPTPIWGTGIIDVETIQKMIAEHSFEVGEGDDRKLKLKVTVNVFGNTGKYGTNIAFGVNTWKPDNK